jgi:hypothetical protein
MNPTEYAVRCMKMQTGAEPGAPVNRTERGSPPPWRVHEDAEIVGAS